MRAFRWESCRRRCWLRHVLLRKEHCFHSAIPTSEFGGTWPPGVPLQIHMMDADEIIVEDGDLDVARELVAAVEGAELFLYRGDRHLFADNSLRDYDESAATLLRQRVLSFLEAVRGYP